MTEVENREKQISPAASKISMLTAAFLMGNIGLIISFLSDLPVYTIVLLRGFFGSVFLLLFAFKTGCLKKAFFKPIFKFKWKHLMMLGMLAPIGVFLYFFSIVLSGYAIAAFLAYTNGIFLLIFLALTREEKISHMSVLSFIFVIIGVAIIMEFWNGFSLTINIIIGIFSGMAIASDVFFKKRMYKVNIGEDIEMNKINFDIFIAFWQNICIVFFFLPLGFTDLEKLTLNHLIFYILLGLFPTAFAYILYNIGLRNDKSGNVFIFAYFEVVIATINTALFLHVLSIYTIIGGCFIILGSYLISKYSK